MELDTPPPDALVAVHTLGFTGNLVVAWAAAGVCGCGFGHGRGCGCGFGCGMGGGRGCVVHRLYAQGSSRHFAWMWRSDLCSILLLWFLSLLMFV